jgi:hypothetical protein
MKYSQIRAMWARAGDLAVKGRLMKERPIIFSGPMVRAILDGRKTMTRRVVKLRDGEIAHDGDDGSLHAVANTTWCDCIERVIHCPYGVPGDLLWVRETWATTEQAGVHPSDAEMLYRATDPDWETMDGWRWSPSIFMPRLASRLTLRITSVRVELVQEITEHDAMREGANAESVSTQPGIYSYRAPFAKLWDSINAKRGFNWDANPLVWVVGFEVAQ